MTQFVKVHAHSRDGDESAGIVEFFLNPGTATAEEIAELFVALSRLNQAYGGAGLKFTVSAA